MSDCGGHAAAASSSEAVFVVTWQASRAVMRLVWLVSVFIAWICGNCSQPASQPTHSCVYTLAARHNMYTQAATMAPTLGMIWVVAHLEPKAWASSSRLLVAAARMACTESRNQPMHRVASLALKNSTP